MTRNTQKNQKSTRLETGRSMVEILGMLAIVGILSALSVVGFQYAMQLTRENSTLDVVDKTTSGAITGLMETKFNPELKEAPIDAELVVSNVDVKSDGHTVETALGTNIVVYRPDEDEIEFTLENITYSVCERLLNRTANYTSARPMDEKTEWNGVYIGDSREKKAAFCKRIDAMERRPLRPGAEVNPKANMVLCYSKTGTECGLPERTDTPCIGDVPHGEKIPGTDCAVCDNGRYKQNEGYQEKTCYQCDSTTGYQEELRNAGQTTVCGDVCCGLEGCNTAGTGCAEGCMFDGKKYASGATIGDCGKCQDGSISITGSKDCNSCDSSTGYRWDPITSSEKDTSGKCCVNGERKYDAGMCPDPKTQCKVGGVTYNNGAAIGDCGKCNNGSVEVDTSKVPDCHECNMTSYTLRNLTSSEKDSTGKCCVNGERKYDAGMCPDPSTQCKVGGKTYNSGSVINTCKQCSNGTIVNRMGYTVPTCKVCNADGTLSNATDGSNASNGQCCVDGKMQASATYCPKDCTVGGATYKSGAAIGDCGKCNNGTAQMNGTWKDTSCQTCSSSTSYKKKNATNGSNASNGQCCVDGKMQASATYCPKDCTVGGATYKSGAAIGDCGKCNNGTAQMNGTWKDTTCQTCSSSTSYKKSNKAAGTAISGKPCQECDGNGGERNKADMTDLGKGICCVSGRPRGEEFCRPCTDKRSGIKYRSGEAIGDCGKCINGRERMDETWKDTECQMCSGMTYYKKVTQPNGTIIGECGMCLNGDIVRNGSGAPTCQTCDTTTWKWKGHTGYVGDCGKCSGKTNPKGSPIILRPDVTVSVCQICDTATNWRIINKVAGTLISGKPCQMCDGNGGERNRPNGSNASDGRCCVNGTMQANATVCPDPKTQCKVDGVTYNNGAAIGDCGKCNNGTAQMNGTWKDTSCQTCSSSTSYRKSNKAAGTAISGKPCKECNGSGGERNKTNGTLLEEHGCKTCQNGVETNAKAGTAISGQPCKECNGSGGERDKVDRTDVGNGKCCFSGQATGTWYWANNKWSCCPSGQTDVGCGCGVAKRSNGMCCAAGEIEAYYAQGGDSTVCCPAGHHYWYNNSKTGWRQVCCHTKTHWPAVNAATCCPQQNQYYSSTSGTSRCCTKAVYDATNGTCYGGGLNPTPCPGC